MDDWVLGRMFLLILSTNLTAFDSEEVGEADGRGHSLIGEISCFWKISVLVTLVREMDEGGIVHNWPRFAGPLKGIWPPAFTDPANISKLAIGLGVLFNGLRYL